VDDIPLLIDFATPSTIFREHNRISTLRIIGNGPSGTFVLLPNGLTVHCGLQASGRTRRGYESDSKPALINWLSWH